MKPTELARMPAHRVLQVYSGARLNSHVIFSTKFGASCSRTGNFRVKIVYHAPKAERHPGISSEKGYWHDRVIVKAARKPESPNPDSETRQANEKASQEAFVRPVLIASGIPGRVAEWKCQVAEGPVSAGQPWCLPGLRDLANSGRYTVWLLDQFGVLHDGQKAYPGAVDALQHLARSGSKVVLLSNSSRRSQATIQKLPALGFHPALFSAVVTSGELTHQNLASREDPWFASLGRKCIHFTWSSRGAISLEGLDLEIVSRPEDAHFLLAHGTEALGRGEGLPPLPTGMEEMKGILRHCSELPTPPPLIVANPDRVTVVGKDLVGMPGALGIFYEELGGFVRWMGKPDPVIYRAAVGSSSAESCVCVGDSLHHDIQGANKAGIDSVFVAGGIHANELHVGENGEAADPQALEILLNKVGWKPTYVIPSFIW